tara:strand:+ start:8346 stop:9224 length:879 start_codon:yes stop_codon:yes gene_type:complete
MSNKDNKSKRQRQVKTPVSLPPKKKDDWLSPLMSMVGGTVGFFLGGAPGAMVGSTLGKVGGRVAAKEAGMSETALTDKLDKASGIGTQLADAAGVGADSSLFGSKESALKEAPAMSPSAQRSVDSGVSFAAQQAAQDVASEGLNASQTAATPFSRMLSEDAGASVPAGVQPLPQGNLSMPMAREEAIGVVPGQGYLYEATPEAANRRRQERLMGIAQANEQRLMSSEPYYDTARASYDASLQQAAADAELADYRRKFGLRPGELGADKRYQDAIDRFKLVVPLEDREYPRYP